MQKFSRVVAEKIGYYVYRLVDPRNGNTFYVGKGNGNRVFAHVNCALSNFDGVNYREEFETNAKYDTIRDIKLAGLEVISLIVRWGMDEKTAYEVESAVMDCYPKLTNIQKGHGLERGLVNAIELNNKLSVAPYSEPEDIDYLIIKTSRKRVDEVGVYEATRSCWKINPQRIVDKYVLAVVDGVVVEVYKPFCWNKVEENGRYEFEGDVAKSEIREVFVNHTIPNKYYSKGMANPIIYKRGEKNE